PVARLHLEPYPLPYTTLFRSLAEADARIEDNALHGYTDFRNDPQPLLKKPADVRHDVVVPGVELHGLRRALHVHENHAGAKVAGDRKSTRLNSSHGSISYAVF